MSSYASFKSFAVLALAFALTACAANANSRLYSEADFQAWLANYRTAALADGIHQKTIDRMLGDVEYLPAVVDKDRNQPEFKFTLAEYSNRIITPQRVERGVEKLTENKTYLRQIEKKYGVPASTVVALWGIETNFGSATGGYDVVDAVATLAYDGRRAEYFRKELTNILRMADQHPTLKRPFMGSWAGAMGQVQFMPTTYVKFAVDGNHDGKIDLWNQTADVFASAANYLAQSGWERDVPWGMKVILREPVDSNLVQSKSKKTLAEWEKLGVTPDPKSFPVKASAKASLLMPEGEDGPAFLVFGNYEVILKWNRSNNFALTVGTLSDQIYRKFAKNLTPDS